MFAEPIILNDMTCRVEVTAPAYSDCHVISSTDGDLRGIAFFFDLTKGNIIFYGPVRGARMSVTHISVGDDNPTPMRNGGECVVVNRTISCRAYFADGSLVEVTAK